MAKCVIDKYFLNIEKWNFMKYIRLLLLMFLINTPALAMELLVQATQENIAAETGDPIQCPHQDCGKFLKPQTLKAHMKNIHGSGSETIMCDFPGCGKEVKRYLLTLHKGNFHDPQIQCAVCGVFVRKYEISTHENTHKALDSEEPAIKKAMIECPLCKQLVHGLSHHTYKMHGEGSKITPCPDCHLPLIQYCLDNHKKVCSTNKVQCNYCPLNIAQSLMKRHIDQQHPAQPYTPPNRQLVPCDQCGQTMTKFQLDTHKENVHSLEIQNYYYCLICNDFTATSTSSICKHLNKQHKISGKYFQNYRHEKKRVTPAT